MASKILPTAKKLAMALLVMLVCNETSLAQQVVIGSTTGSTSYFYGPYYRSTSGSGFNYSNYCYLYTAAELGIPPGSMITSIEWYKASGTITGNNTFSIWMENTAATSLTSGTTLGTLMGTATQVYTSTTQSFIAANNSYESFTLTAPFLYTGGSLQILTDHVKAGTASAANLYYYNAATNMGIGYASSVAATSTTTLNTANYGNQRPTVRITYVPGTPCSAAPTAGTANATVTNACAGAPFGLSLTGSTVASGIGYQWYTRAGSTGPWVPISGATTAAYTVTNQTAATQYRAVVTCTALSLSDSSSIVAVGQNSFLNCYCASSANSTADDDIGQVIIGSLTNPASYGTLFSNASSVNTYTDYTSLPPTNMTTGTPIPVNITQIQSTTFYYTCYLKIYIDLNQNGQFDASEELFGQDGHPTTLSSPSFTGTLTIPTTATTGVTRMRIILWESGTSTSVLPCVAGNPFGYGETEDYLVNIVGAPTCNTTPTAGTASASAPNACVGVPFTVNLTGYTTGVAGLAIQWQTRAGTSGPWTNITGATTASETVTQSVASQYRAYIRCVSTNQADTSNIITVGQNIFLNCYCASAANSTADDDIGQVVIGSLTNPASYGTLFSNAASVNTYTDYTSLPATTLSTGTPIPVDITQIQSTTFYYTCYLKIYIDLNQNGQFDASEELFGQNGHPSTLSSPTFTGTITIPGTATPGITRMRIILWESGSSTTVMPCVAGNPYGYGETEDYLVNITNFPLSNSKVNLTAANLGKVNKVEWTTASENKSNTFKVERSADGENFEQIGIVKANSTSSEYTYLDGAPFSGTNYYRLKLVNIDGSESYTQVVTASVKSGTAFTVNAYPNPVIDVLTVKIYGEASGRGQVTISDITGKVVRSAILAGDKADIDMSELTNGIYMVKYTDNTHTQTIRVNKQ